MKRNTPVKQREIELGEQDTIITKTDLKGKITYINEDFCRISGFSENESLGKSHNIVRHPDMPPAAFADLWSTIKKGQPWNGIVKNRCKNGDYYWVDAYVSPAEEDGRIVGYISMRTKPCRNRVQEAEQLYRRLGEDDCNFILRQGRALPRYGWRSLDPHTWLSGLNGPQQMVLLIGAFMTGYGLLAGSNYRLWQQTGFNTPVFQRLEMQQALRGDFQPSQADLLESWQLALEMLTAEPSELPALAEKSHELQQNFERRRQYWLDSLPDGKLKQIVIEDSENASRTFLALIDQQFIPALLNGDYQQALAILPAMKRDYRRHRQNLDNIADLSGSEYASLRTAAMETASTDAWLQAAAGLTLLALIALISRLVYRNLMRVGDPLYIAGVVRHMATGNLSIGIGSSEHGDDSIPGQLKDLQARLRHLVTLIADKSKQVADEAGQMSAAAKHTAESAYRQCALTGTVSTATVQMTANVAQLAASADAALQISRQSSLSCEQGVGIIDNAVGSMRQIATTVKEAACTLGDLDTSSEQISKVINVIRNVAEQTNLLALNAAIEAARAGDQGRGFAVVADEVRKLAERTSQSTKEIETMIVTIQSGMKIAAGKMEEGVRQVDAGVVFAQQAGESIDRIHDDAGNVAREVTAIAAALAEQQMVSEQIAQSIAEIDYIAADHGAAANQTVQGAELLEETSRQLRGSVSRFMI